MNSRSFGIKKTFSFIIAAALICAAFAGFAVINDDSGNVLADETANAKMITLTIGSPTMTVDGAETPIDENGTAPVLVNDRTLLPVRAIIEAVGGTVVWNDNADAGLVTLTYGGSEIVLVIDSTTAYLNGKEQVLDSAPTVINDRTMLPIRFIAESFGFSVDWIEESETVIITVPDNNTTQTTPAAGTTDSGEPAVLGGLEHRTDNTDDPIVYFTSDISSEGLVEIYEMLGFEPQGNVSVKLSTGEPPASHYLDPDLIKDLVQSVNGTIVECNTAYGGSRSNTEMHKQVAEDHGFTAIADVDIMDENGSVQIPVSDKAVNLQYDIVGANYENYDSMIVLSHFKGHAMGGFGGAIKNTSIGVSSSEGKLYIHSGGHSTTSWGGGTQDQFLESMAEASQAVYNDRQQNGGIVYISVMNNLSVDCDCDGNPAEPEMNDVGILASYDPVALDQACVDIVYNTPDEESGALQERIESRNGIHTLEHAESIGLGSRSYRLADIDI